MRRIKITVLPPCSGPVAAIIQHCGEAFTPGDHYCLPNGAGGPIIKIELVMEAHSTMTVDHTTP